MSAETTESTPQVAARKGLRWWPAAVVLLVAGGVLVWIRGRADWSFQQRNLRTLGVVLATVAALLVWWLTASRAPKRLRLAVVGVLVGVVALAGLLFRLRGVSGDLVPIVEPRWALPRLKAPASPAPEGQTPAPGEALDFPQFEGPGRTAILAGPALEEDWSTHPPRVMWRQPIGAAWSGWAIVSGRAFTQEQHGTEECSTCYDLATGGRLWSDADSVRYSTTIAGEGPRCTPTVVSNRVYTLGATGILKCLEAATGRRLWSRDIVADGHSRVPDWGFAGSPLVFGDKVIVSAGGGSGRSLLAYDATSGEIVWAAGDQPASYSSPVLADLCGRREILAFNHRRITAHEAATGRVLWEYPWGNGQPQVAVPVVVGANRVLFSSGYGVGSELLEIAPGESGSQTARRVWRSPKMKSKFADLVQRDGFLYGLDDGVLSCLDLSDGSRRWRGARYGHGQSLLVRDLLVLMAEDGELVLLRPTPDAPHELHRFRVFRGKTWNPFALSGDVLLARTDREAACLRLALRGPRR